MDVTAVASQPAPLPVLAFDRVTLAFDGPPVLEDVTFSVSPG